MPAIGKKHRHELDRRRRRLERARKKSQYQARLRRLAMQMESTITSALGRAKGFWGVDLAEAGRMVKTWKAAFPAMRDYLTNLDYAPIEARVLRYSKTDAEETTKLYTMQSRQLSKIRNFTSLYGTSGNT